MQVGRQVMPLYKKLEANTLFAPIKNNGAGEQIDSTVVSIA